MPSPSWPIPDLLCEEAAARVDLAALRQALVFAFAAGGSEEQFAQALAKADFAPSAFDPAGYAQDLYIGELVEKCFTVRIDGQAYPTSTRYVARAVGSPPDDLRDADLRRGVLAEIVASPALRSELEGLYRSIVSLRSVACAGRQVAPRVRRVEILRAARAAFERMAGSFAGSTSALARIRDFGVAVVAGDGHRRLVEFLEYEENQTAIELRVRVDADGEVRSMQIMGFAPNRSNPFYRSVIGRLAVHIVLFLRGYRTTAGEIAERLLSEIFAGIEEPVALVFQLLGDVEVYLGALGFRDQARERGLSATLVTLAAEHDRLELCALYNPLLVASGVMPVACDLRAAPGAIVVVTGPNSGGKTRLLQSVAIAQLLGQAGFFAPAAGGQLPRAAGLFASLHEEARADQPEGHLGMELLRIRRLFERMGPDGFVVIDELCSGTNPSEGEEIARLVLSLLPELGVRGFVTTHLLSFAMALSRENGSGPLEFLQVELDAHEVPTYRFVPGVASTSLAHKTAARLGVTRDELLARISKKRQVPKR